tara:strand:- start:174 stop:1166 length:993 start_codon:yes stop_codon:yes gene_type:complete
MNTYIDKVNLKISNLLSRYKNKKKRLEKEFNLTSKNTEKHEISNLYSLNIFVSFLLSNLFGKRYETVNPLPPKTIITIFWRPVRRLLLNIIRKTDGFLNMPFGSREYYLPRTLKYGHVEIDVKVRSQFIDYRNKFWKRDSLTSILEIIKEKRLKNINFLEIGAASGLVSLFLAKWAKDNLLKNNIYCVEPSLSNVQFLEESSDINSLDINILPVALSESSEWVSFAKELKEGKGLVGEGITNYDYKIEKKPALSFAELRNYIKKIDICYIDALKNENKILEGMLNIYDEIPYLIIEFDYGIGENITNLLSKKRYSIIKKQGLEYIFQKNE